jgi:hypothetical protein
MWQLSQPLVFMMLAGLLLGLFYLEDGGEMFFRNVG